jgi:hypothetical protein
MRMGSFPAIAMSAGVGLLVCAVANALSRSTVTSSHLLYLAGIAGIAVPIFYRLSSREPSPGERLALVCLLGLAFYAVKVIREPFLFTVPDEFLHAYNVDLIGLHNQLFEPNPILPVSAYYPGLEGATSALMDTTGMSSLAAGTIVVGAARLVLSIGLFFLFTRISGSAWIAGIGAALYAGNPNFLILGAQYSYQSLALPLLVVILWTVVEREAAPPRWMRTWAVPTVLMTVAVVVTHHATSYGLAIFFVALTVAYRGLGRGWQAPNPAGFAVLTIVLAAVWVLVVSITTVEYLGRIFESALTAAIDTVTGAASARTPFESTSNSSLGATPILARAVAITSLLILLACLPLGLRETMRRHRSNPFVLVLSVMAVAFFGAVLLRIASAASGSAAWEIGDRASEFLFIGLAFVVAHAFVVGYERVRVRRRGGTRAARGLLTAAFAIIVTGGVISGWPWDAQLAEPTRVKADGRLIESEPLGLARWANENLRGEKFLGPVADAYPLLAPGGVRALGASHKADNLLQSLVLTSSHRRYLRNRNVRFVVADRRRAAPGYVRGYFFEVRPLPPRGERLGPRGPVRKYKHIQTAAPIFHSGNIVVFDLAARP